MIPDMDDIMQILNDPKSATWELRKCLDALIRDRDDLLVFNEIQRKQIEELEEREEE